MVVFQIIHSNMIIINVRYTYVLDIQGLGDSRSSLTYHQNEILMCMLATVVQCASIGDGVSSSLISNEPRFQWQMKRSSRIKKLILQMRSKTRLWRKLKRGCILSGLMLHRGRKTISCFGVVHFCSSREAFYLCRRMTQQALWFKHSYFV